jgi:hypothetical protein
VLSVGWLIVAVVVAVLLTVWITFTLTRLDRLHARVDAAQAALDAQLVRRAAALQHVLESASSGLPRGDLARYEAAATRALAATGPARETAENEVGRVIAELEAAAADVRPAERGELHEACVRVAIARRFYNDAVRDTRSLRGRRMPRILHLAGHREMPRYFDIDDTVIFPDEAAPRSHQETRP